MERKYRLWDKEKKRFITPVIMDVEEIDITLDMLGNVLYCFPYESGWATVIGNERFDIQFSTGIKDLNGTEIFEGDILKHIDFESNECAVNVVYMKHGSLVFDIEIDESVYDVPVYKIHPEASKTYEDILEIIGNIHENPELLGRLNNENHSV